MQIQIDKGVDINQYGANGFCWNWVKNMDVGDSVLITNKMIGQLGSSWTKEKFRTEMMRALWRFKMKGKSRRVENGNFRVWRVA